MNSKELLTTRSFIVVLYDKAFKERGYFPVPVSVAAPFANRLFREMIPDQEQTVREPWYSLVAHWSDEDRLQRASSPVGPTSLYSECYVPEEEPPPRVALHPQAKVRHFTVCLLDFQTELFRGEYSVDDIFLAGAEFLARGWIKKGEMQMDEGPFYYEIIPSPNAVYTVPQDLFPPEAFQVEGVFPLPSLDKDRPRIEFRKVIPAPLPERGLGSYVNTHTYGRGEQRNGRIIMHAGVYQALQEGIFLKPKVEDGGYLLGVPYRQPESPGSEDDPEFRWLVEITDVVQAEGAWGKPAMLLFTGETWSQIHRNIDRDYPDKKLAGWFHTHLFKGTGEFGLSGFDRYLHQSFLTKPWQVAVLLNIDADGGREVRCFQRGPEGVLVECTFEVFDTVAGGDPS